MLGEYDYYARYLSGWIWLVRSISDYIYIYIYIYTYAYILVGGLFWQHTRSDVGLIRLSPLCGKSIIFILMFLHSKKKMTCILVVVVSVDMNGIYPFIHEYICVCIWDYTCDYISIWVYACIYIFIYDYAHECVCIYIYIYIYMILHMSVYICICIHVYMYIYTLYIYIYI